jgi:hypothetical protein
MPLTTVGILWDTLRKTVSNNQQKQAISKLSYPCGQRFYVGEFIVVYGGLYGFAPYNS